ncbi:calcium-binding protein [Microvirga terrae]|uniref:Calcium-binding protein n=1 Tax=Microvirga terrae TaxID=2740529 RepID=A0ABY5RZK2_9HYPH|nr:calcium-binding protein [Microvirga terrae]UVF21612.1 calcium-binding protein [Microvirga terrae]
MFYHYDLGLDPWAFGSFGNDRVTIDEDGSVVFTGFGRDTVRVRADEVTVDLGFGRDVVRTYGDDIVVNGRFGRDRLLGGDGADSLWGNFREDVIRTGKGADYALGNQGNDLTDTGESLGIHFGGAGNDTFFIGQEIVGNGARDTVIALDFGNGRDRLDIAPEILANVARVEEGKVDLVPVLAAFEAEGLGVPEVGQRLSQTFLGDLAFREVARFLEQFPPNEQGLTALDPFVLFADY